MQYLPRIYDTVLKRKLRASDAILIEGAKWCGKTTTAEQIAGSRLYMQKPDAREQNIRLAQISPSMLLEGETPRLIDEWQLAPELWDAVRFECDHRGKFGQFILTGSTVPPERGAIKHTGTGRIGRIRMRPMSLVESGDSTGSVSLRSLLEGAELPMVAGAADIGRIAFLTARGGWPRAIRQDDDVALQQAYNYVDAIAETEVSEVDKTQRSPERARLIMRSYARFTASQGKVSQMVADMSQSDVVASDKTVRTYLDVMKNLFVIEELSAWNPNLRSKAAIRTTNTRHYTDPSIAVAALGTDPDGLIADLRTFGLLFEGLCIRDLRCYMDELDGFVSHYRDSSGLECDAVVHLRDGTYGLVEVKLGGDDLIEEGASSLKSLRDAIDTDKMGSPAFCMVLVGVGEYSYLREDGIFVVPICALGA